MRYRVVPALQHLMFAKISLLLWNSKDVLVLSERHRSFYTNQFDSWLEMADQVMEKIPGLRLPTLMKNKIKGVIYSMGLQSYQWVMFHSYYCQLETKLPDELCWNPEGTIDMKKTAEIFVMNENIPLYQRYKMACTYCLEHQVNVLWRRISHGEFYAKDLKKIRMYEKPLVLYWSHFAAEKLPELEEEIGKWSDRTMRCNEYQFLQAADSGNETATVYFLQKLPPETKERLVVQAAKAIPTKCSCVPREKIPSPRDMRADVMCFLLSVMTEEQKTEVCSTHPSYVLDCYLDWPWQVFFIEQVESMWDFLPVLHYGVLLLKIAKAGTSPCADYNYKELFKQFWRESPPSCKAHVVDTCTRGSGLFSKLLSAGDKENIKLVLNSATLQDKEKFILHKGGYIYENLVQENRWELLKFFVQQCISTKNAMTEFKVEFAQHISDHYPPEKRNESDVKDFFKYVDDFILQDEPQNMEGAA